MNTYTVRMETEMPEFKRIDPKEYQKFLEVRRTLAKAYSLLGKKPYNDRAQNTVKEYKQTLQIQPGKSKIVATFLNGHRLEVKENSYTNKKQLRVILRNQIKNLLFKSKKPLKDNATYVGIEIECIIPNGRRDLERDLEPYAAWVTVGEDGSIRTEDEGESTCEIKIIIQREEREILQNVMQILNNHDAYVNQSCGLHVHLDFREGTGRKQVAGYKALWQYMQVLYAMQPQSRRLNTYCAPNPSNRIRRRGNRYQGINATAIRKFGTIEIRMHSGTTNFTKIWNWVTLLNTIVELGPIRKPRVGEINLSTDALLSRIQSPELVQYIKERMVQFGARVTSTVPIEASEIQRQAA